MKISYEYEANIYNYFEFFQGKEKIQKEKIPPMSMFTMDAIRIWSQEMERSFYKAFAQKLKKIKNENKTLDSSGRKLYCLWQRKLKILSA